MHIRIDNAFHSCDKSLLDWSAQHDMTAALKKALYYDTMDLRKSQLSDVDAASFDWIWTETRFPQWLENNEPIFWICGKPGSGKSTLIHHLIDDFEVSQKVNHYLSLSHPDPLVVYFFFDFRAGSGIANTPTGMLRSLLLQLVEKSHDIEEYIVKKCGYKLEGKWLELETELIRVLTEALRGQQHLLCAFFDGLDEYTGDLSVLMDTILSLPKRANIKLCLASRPAPALTYKLKKEAFWMQSHNAITIRAYTERALSGLYTLHDDQTLEHITALVEQNADGVILWARFAVDEIVSAILQGCGVEEVEAHLEAFPKDLENFYDLTMRGLDPTQRLQSSVIFFVIEHCRPRLTMESFMMLCHRIIYKLYDSAERSLGLHPKRFKLKLQVMLRGLVEFIPDILRKSEYPHFVHKTLLTFLQTDVRYQSLASQLSLLYDKQHLSCHFHADNILLASDTLMPDPHLIWPNIACGGENALESLLRKHDSHLLGFNACSTVSSLHFFVNQSLPTQAQYVNLIVRALQSWLFREWILQRLILLKAPPQEQITNVPGLQRRVPELFWLIGQGYHIYFDVAISNGENHLSPDDFQVLFCFVLSRFVVRFSGCFRSTFNSSIGREKIWQRMLPHLGFHALYFSLCIITHHLDMFNKILPKISDIGITKSHIPPSLWWHHPASHLLLCWAGSPFHVQCKETQRRRLRVLLDAGQSLNECIYRNGDVMCALLDEKLWKCSSFLASEQAENHNHRANLPHFSRAKFYVLIEARYHPCNASGYGSLLSMATNLRESFLGREPPFESAYYYSDLDAAASSTESFDAEFDGTLGESSPPDYDRIEDITGTNTRLRIEHCECDYRTTIRNYVHHNSMAEDLDNHVIPWLKIQVMKNEKE